LQAGYAIVQKHYMKSNKINLLSLSK